MAGLSFLPSATSAFDKSGAKALSPGQSAVDVISLNLPRILGAKPLASANLLGGGETGATHATGVDPSQLVMQALMRSSMATVPSAAPTPSLLQPSTSAQPGVSAPATGTVSPLSSEEELRKLLEGMFGTSMSPTPATTPAPAPSTPTPTAPIFTPGDSGLSSTPPPPPSPTTQRSVSPIRQIGAQRQ